MDKTIKEITEDFKENVKERLNHPFWSTFTLFWFAFNWRAIISFFVIPSDNLELFANLDEVSNKLDFINSNLWLSEYGWGGSIVRILGPFILVYVYYWYLKPWLVDPVNRKVNENELNKIEVSKKREELVSENKENWSEDFIRFFNSNYKVYMKKMIHLKYSNNGFFSTEQFQSSNHMNLDGKYEPEENFNYIPPEVLAYFNSNGLILLDSNSFDFTEKGLFFVKLFQDKNINLSAKWS